MLSRRKVRKDSSYQALSWSVGALSHLHRIANNSEMSAIKQTVQGDLSSLISSCRLSSPCLLVATPNARYRHLKVGFISFRVCGSRSLLNVITLRQSRPFLRLVSSMLTRSRQLSSRPVRMYRTSVCKRSMLLMISCNETRLLYLHITVAPAMSPRVS